jgi:hypothetical protein
VTTIATTWLFLSLSLAAYAWFAYRTPYVLPALAVMAALCMWVPTGTPRLTTPPAGRYTVLGADIQVNVAIYVLLKDGNAEARYFRLPYSNEQANALQQALDASQGHGGVSANVGEEGGVQYDGENPVSSQEAPKQAEQPALSIPPDQG